MAVAPILGAVAAIGGLASSAVQFIGQQKVASAQRRQERIRRQQADLEAARRRRQIIREAAINRAQTIAQAGGQGIGFGGSSLPGALSGQSNAAASNTLGVNQAQSLGGQMFSAQAAEGRGRSIAGIGQGISSLGGAAVKAYNAFQ